MAMSSNSRTISTRESNGALYSQPNHKIDQNVKAPKHHMSGFRRED
jgi:hypothetical protein